MASLDPITNTVIYNDKEQFDNEYDNFGNRTSSLAPSVDNPSGLETAIPNAATTPGSTTSQIDSQSTSEVSLVEGFLQSSNFVTGSAGWRIDSDGNAEFNNGVFRGSITASSISIGSGFHVDTSGNVWWGASPTFAGAAIWINSAGTINLTSGNFSGNLAAPSGQIGGWTIGPISLYSGAISLDSANTRIKAAVDSDNYVEMYGNAGAGDSYIHGQVAAAPAFYFGYKDSGTYNILNNLRIADVISVNPSLPNYPYAAFLVDSGAPNYLRVDVYNSAVSIAPFYFNGDGSFEPPSITLGGVNHATWPTGATTLSALTIDTAKSWGSYGITSLGTILPSGDASYNLGSVGNSWALGYIGQIKGGTVNDNTIDLSSEAANILINKNFVPSSDNSVTSGSAGRRWSDLRSVLINGVSFLSEKNVIRELDSYDFLTNMPRVIEFTWKVTNEANQGRTFWGFAADDLPPTISDIEGKSANVMGAIAYAFGAIKQLREEVNLLKAK